jgi:hypothetical protein
MRRKHRRIDALRRFESFIITRARRRVVVDLGSVGSRG